MVVAVVVAVVAIGIVVAGAVRSVKKALGRKRYGLGASDLRRWSKTAKKRGSEILLAGESHPHVGMRPEDAEERIQAWYLESLLQRRIEDEEAGHGRRDDESDDWRLEHDEERNDGLICFWIDTYNPTGSQKGSLHRMYVCVDPQSGAILPQSIEAEYR